MKVVILAGGEGKRLRPLTEKKPKPMVEVAGKPILHHIIDALPDAITDIILVTGYMEDAIKDYFGDMFEERPITYVHQDARLGTAHALGLCRQYITKDERFLFMAGDDLHSKKALTELLQHDQAVLVKEHDKPERFGVIEVGDDQVIKSIEEKPESPKSNLVSTGVYVLSEKIFHYPAKLEENGEYYVPDQVQKMIGDHPVFTHTTDFWHPISYPEDVDAAEKIIEEK